MATIYKVADLEFSGSFALGDRTSGYLRKPDTLSMDRDIQHLRRVKCIYIFPERRGLLAELELVPRTHSGE